MFIQKFELKNFRHFLEIHYTLSFVLYGLWYLGNGSLQWTDFLNIDIFLYFHWKWILTYFKLYCVLGKKDREEICMFKFLPNNSENMICFFNVITVLLVLSGMIIWIYLELIQLNEKHTFILMLVVVIKFEIFGSQLWLVITCSGVKE